MTIQTAQHILTGIMYSLPIVFVGLWIIASIVCKGTGNSVARHDAAYGKRAANTNGMKD